MKAKIVELPEIILAGLSCKTSEKDNKENATIPKLWDTFIPFMQILKPIPIVSYGVGWSDEMPDQFTEEGQFEYLAGIEADEFDLVPDNLEQFIIEPGRYAMFEHIGSLDRLPETYELLYSRWLDENALLPRQGIEIERYGSRFNIESENSVLEIFIPVK